MILDTAACKGQANVMFAGPGERPPARIAREAIARALCAQCAHTTLCREFARQNGEYGFWGGESEAERTAAGFPPR